MIHHEQLPTAGFGEDPFPIGRAVEVTGGLYRGDRGIVAHQQTPDLRPGSVWVLLDNAGLHLVHGTRLIPTGPDPFPPHDDGYPR